MDKNEVLEELSADSDAVRDAVLRGLEAAYDGSWHDIEGEFSGYIRGIIIAVRAAIEPLTSGQ